MLSFENFNNPLKTNIEIKTIDNGYIVSIKTENDDIWYEENIFLETQGEIPAFIFNSLSILFNIKGELNV